MKKKLLIILALTLCLTLSLFAVAAADVTPETYESVFQGEYEDGALSGDATIVFGTVDPATENYGVSISYYGDSRENEPETVERFGESISQDGKFGIALFALPDGYYTAKVFADGVYAEEEVKFSVGADYTTYVVKHFQQQLDGNYSEVTADAQTFEGKVGTEVTATAKTYEHYVLDAENANAKASGEVLADGELELKLYYNLEKVTFTFDYQGGTDGSEATQKQIDYMYGQEVVAPTLTKDGTRLMGWATNLTDGYYATVDATATTAKTYKAVWYNEDWLKFDSAASNFAVTSVYRAGTTPANGAYWEKNIPAEVINIDFMKGAKIALPAIDVSRVKSISFEYRVTWSGASGDQWPGVWLNAVPTADGGYAKSFKVLAGTTSEYATVEITGEQVRAAVSSGKLDYLTFVGRGYASITFAVRNVVVETNPEFFASYLDFGTENVLDFVSSYSRKSKDQSNWLSVTASIENDVDATDGKVLKIDSLGNGGKNTYKYKGFEIDISQLGYKLSQIDEIEISFKTQCSTNAWKYIPLRINPTVSTSNTDGAFPDNIVFSAKTLDGQKAFRESNSKNGKWQTMKVTGDEIAAAIELGQKFGNTDNFTCIGFAPSTNGYEVDLSIVMYIDYIHITLKDA